MTNDVMDRENHYGTSEERHQDYTSVEKVKGIPDEPEGKWCHWPTLVAYVGPGFLVCIAYLDPGNLEADLQVRMGMIGIPFDRRRLQQQQQQ